MLFQSDTQSNVVDNLGKGTVVQIVRVLLCLDLLFTIPMLLAVSREVIEGSLIDSRSDLSSRQDTTFRNVTRFALVLLLMAIGLGMIASNATTAFGNIVTLIGGFFNSILGFILPPLFTLQIKGHRMSKLAIAANASIAILGALLLVSSTIITVEGMINGS